MTRPTMQSRGAATEKRVRGLLPGALRQLVRATGLPEGTVAGALLRLSKRGEALPPARLGGLWTPTGGHPQHTAAELADPWHNAWFARKAI